MPLHPQTQNTLKILRFLKDKGCSCTVNELRATEFGGVGWDIILEQDLIVRGFVDHNEQEARYTLTQSGKEYLDDQGQFDN